MPFNEKHDRTTVDLYIDDFFSNQEQGKIIDFNMLKRAMMISMKIIMLRWQMSGLCYPKIKEFDDFFVNTYDLQGIKNSGAKEDEMRRILINLPSIMALAGTRRGLERLFVIRNQSANGTVYVPVIKYSDNNGATFNGEHYYSDRYVADGEGISFFLGSYEIHLQNSTDQLYQIIKRFKSARDIIIIDP
jgi:hypothetical protein